ncbi:MAG: cytochrome c oxidase subunit 2A [Caldilineaceae bacterium]
MKDPDTPKGAIALMIVYAIMILVLWSNVYLTLLSRGATQ